MTDVMLDIETLGTEPGYIVLSVGACTFDLATGEIGDNTFYETLMMVPQQQVGLDVDVRTLRWWLTQDEAARAEAFKEGNHPSYAASRFQTWFKLVGGITIWSQGNIDMPMWQHVMNKFNINEPWDFWNIRDTRTLYDLARYRSNFNYKKDVPREGTYHNALDDAKHQVRCCHAAWSAL